MMTSNIRILAEFTRDWMIAMALILIACIGSGYCQQNLTPNVDLYLLWFVLWMVPFVLYARWRGVGDCDRRWGKFAVHMLVLIGSWQIVVLLFGREIGLFYWFVVMIAEVFLSPFIGQRPLLDRDERSDETKADQP